jgi:hypothetical protein
MMNSNKIFQVERVVTYVASARGYEEFTIYQDGKQVVTVNKDGLQELSEAIHAALSDRNNEVEQLPAEDFLDSDDLSDKEEENEEEK